MTQDAPVRSKQQELFGKMHLGMDHVLAKLLLDAPSLPDSLRLQTEMQSLGTTWVQVTESFEKRKAMLQRHKEKEKIKNKNKRREEASAKEKKSKAKDTKTKSMQKSKSRSSSASPRSGKSSPSVKTEKKSIKKKKVASPRVQKPKTDAAVVKEVVEPNAYEKSVLKKLRKLPMCQNVAFGTNKYRAIVKWMELDKGKDAGTSPEVMKLLTKLQLEVAPEKTSKLKLSRKRSLESLDDALRAENRSKRKSPSGDRKRGQKQRASYVDEDEVVYESGEEEEETEYNGGYSDSDEAEFVPELDYSPPPEKPKKRGGARLLKRQKQEVEEKKENETPVSSTGASQMTTSREQLAAVVAKIRADAVASVKETKYLSYEKKAEPVKPGASPKSAIVLDDSEEEEDEEEEEEEEEEETSVGGEEEESKEAQEQDSSTDDDQGLFDLNEEDVYVVEAILCVKEGRVLLSTGGQRRPKEADLYLVKWEGYDELTWEPDENIPRRLIEMFRERERAKRACQYQIKVAHERRVVTNVTTQAKEVIYMIQWINQDLPVWESRTTLPTKTQVWLDKVLGATPVFKKRRETKAAKQYIYQ